MAAPKTALKTALKTTAKPAGTVIDLGSSSIQPGGMHAPAVPAGTLHLVDGWEPLCGGARVRFVFPGRQAADDTCPACVKATLPRPRAAARSRAAAR
jgi:hypothetical protein